MLNIETVLETNQDLCYFLLLHMYLHWWST